MFAITNNIVLSLYITLYKNGFISSIVVCLLHNKKVLTIGKFPVEFIYKLLYLNLSQYIH